MKRWAMLLMATSTLIFACGPRTPALNPGKRWTITEPPMPELQKSEHPPLMLDEMPARSAETSDREGLPELVVGTGHSMGIADLAIAPNGRWLVTAGGTDSTLSLWDASRGRKLRQIKGHADDVNGVAISPDGRLVASGSDDSTIRIWDAKTGKSLRAIKMEPFALSESAARVMGEVRALRFSPDGTKLAAVLDAHPRIFSVETGQELHALLMHAGDVYYLSFSPDGEQVVTSTIASKDGDGQRRGAEVIGWRVADGARRWTRVLDGTARDNPMFAPDGKRMAVVVGDQAGSEIVMLDAEDGRVLSTFGGSTARVRGADWSPNGKVLALTRDDGIELANPDTGTITRRISVPAHLGQVAGGPLQRGLRPVRFSPDGRTLFVATGSQVRSFDVAAGALRGVYGVTSRIVRQVRIDAQYRFLYAFHGAPERRPSGRLWDLQLGGVRRATAPRGKTQSLALSPQLTHVAAGSMEGALTIWDLATAEEVRSEKVHDKAVQAVAYSPDGRFLATGSDDEKIRLWAADTMKLVKELPLPGDLMHHLVFSSDSRWLVTCAYLGEKVRIYGVPDGKLQATLEHDDNVQQVRISPDGRYVATVQSFLYEGRQIKVWDWREQTLLYLLTDRHTNWAGGLAFSPDGSQLAFVRADNSIGLWTVGAPELVTAAGHAAGLNDLRYTHDGRHLLSASADGTIRVWEPHSGALVLTMASIGDGTDWVAATPDGLFDGTPQGWRLLSWRFGGDSFRSSAAEVFFGDFFRPGLVTDIFSGKKLSAPANIEDVDRRQPIVRLSAPEVGRKTSKQREVKLRVQVREVRGGEQGSGARDVRLFRDGVMVHAWRGDVLGGKESVELETTVPISAGKNQFVAYAFNRDNIKSVDARVRVNGDSSLSRKGVLYLVGIGINRYQNSGFDLAYAGSDADTLVAALKKQQKSLSYFSEIRTVRLSDAEATKENILAALDALGGAPPPASAPASMKKLSKAGPEDFIVLFFAGHGLNRKNTFFMLPHDLGYQGQRSRLDASAVEQILAHSISDQELAARLYPVQAGHVLMIIDACHAGQALGEDEARVGPMNARGLAQLAYDKGMNILTAAQADQVAKEASALGHGFLTYALVADGLQSGRADMEPRDGKITEREWLNYATYRVPAIHEQFVRTSGRALELVDESGTVNRKAVRAHLQHPRVFYRREASAEGMVVAKTASP
jgi:WD40 repeat protein/uncharacterized caspase-like protein